MKTELTARQNEAIEAWKVCNNFSHVGRTLGITPVSARRLCVVAFKKLNMPESEKYIIHKKTPTGNDWKPEVWGNGRNVPHLNFFEILKLGSFV